MITANQWFENFLEFQERRKGQKGWKIKYWIKNKDKIFEPWKMPKWPYYQTNFEFDNNVEMLWNSCKKKERLSKWTKNSHQLVERECLNSLKFVQKKKKKYWGHFYFSKRMILFEKIKNWKLLRSPKIVAKNNSFSHQESVLQRRFPLVW